MQDRHDMPGATGGIRTFAVSRRAVLKAAAAGALAAPLAGCTRSSSASDSDQEDLDKVKSVRIGADCAYPPYEWLIRENIEESLPVSNRGGKYAVGFDILLAKELASHYGIEPVLVNLEHTQLLNYLAEGLVDVVISAYGETDNREQYAEFSDGYRPYELGVVARLDSPYINASTIEDLAGATAVVKDATLIQEAAKTIPGITLLDPVSTVKETYQAVVDGTADITIVDRAGFAMRDHNWASISLASVPADEMPAAGDGYMHVAVRKDEDGMVSDVNEFLRSLGEEHMDELWQQTLELEKNYGPLGEFEIV